MKLIKTVLSLHGWLIAAATAAEPYKIHQVSRESSRSRPFAGTVSATDPAADRTDAGRIPSIAGQEGDGFDQGTVLVELDDSGLLARLEAAVAAQRRGRRRHPQRARPSSTTANFTSPRSNSAGSAPGGMGMPAMMDQMFTSPMQA